MEGKHYATAFLEGSARFWPLDSTQTVTATGAASCGRRDRLGTVR